MQAARDFITVLLIPPLFCPTGLGVAWNCLSHRHFHRKFQRFDRVHKPQFDLHVLVYRVYVAELHEVEICMAIAAISDGKRYFRTQEHLWLWGRNELAQPIDVSVLERRGRRRLRSIAFRLRACRVKTCRGWPQKSPANRVLSAGSNRHYLIVTIPSGGSLYRLTG